MIGLGNLVFGMSNSALFLSILVLKVALRLGAERLKVAAGQGRPLEFYYVIDRLPVTIALTVWGLLAPFSTLTTVADIVPLAWAILSVSLVSHTAYSTCRKLLHHHRALRRRAERAQHQFRAIRHEEESDEPESRDLPGGDMRDDRA